MLGSLDQSVACVSWFATLQQAQLHLTPICRQCQVSLFGSRAVGLALPGADVDLMVRGDECSTVLNMYGIRKQRTMLQLGSSLVKAGGAARGSLTALAFVRVPILKFTAAPDPHMPVGGFPDPNSSHSHTSVGGGCCRCWGWATFLRRVL